MLGVQGAGKTTFGELFAEIAAVNNKKIVSVSIDDFYLPFEDRQKLKSIDSRFSRRGPPGTHDVDMLENVIQNFIDNKLPIETPVFEKHLHKGEGDRDRFIKHI